MVKIQPVQLAWTRLDFPCALIAPRAVNRERRAGLWSLQEAVHWSPISSGPESYRFLMKMQPAVISSRFLEPPSGHQHSQLTRTQAFLSCLHPDLHQTSLGCKWLHHRLASQSQPHLPAVHPADSRTRLWRPLGGGDDEDPLSFSWAVMDCGCFSVADAVHNTSYQ
uniref:SFRICE_018791 n=1 Tax=Spodoptera frugiperda TaxID=7108 RepID=A0A2H1VV48_SPOFR